MSTMIAFLPPISAMTFLTPSSAGCCAAWLMMRRPTSMDPVKAMRSTPGWRTRKSPTSPPGLGRKLTVPGGAPAASRMRTSCAAMTGVGPAGLTMTGLPATSAALVMPVRMASGKFQGAITRATPRGW